MIKELKEIKPNGLINANITFSDDTLYVKPNRMFSDEYYLVLVDTSKKSRRIFYEAKISDGTLIFENINREEFSKSTDKTWMVHLGFKELGRLRLLRLRQNGDTAVSKKEAKDGEMRLWKDSNERYLGDVCRVGESIFEFVLNEKKNTLSLTYMAENTLNVIRENNIYHLPRVTKTSYKYLFSVVMAVYNREAYLEESIESIISQDIGFEKNVQLILVDDGSTDSSGAICDRYHEKYPDNILVIHKENGGVAAARNEGKKKATGKYINFCDSDDKLSVNAMSTVNRFFEAHSSETDVVTMPIHIFDGYTSEHWQNYKFEDGERVIDLWTEYDASCMFVTATFFVTDIAKKYDFISTSATAEDMRFIFQILLERMTLGVVCDCRFYYRKASAGGSLVDTSHQKKNWYLPQVKDIYRFMFEYSKRKYGFVPQFTKNEVMMDLQWRFRVWDYVEGTLSAIEMAQYRTAIKSLLAEIDDDIIINQRAINGAIKYQIFRMKYGKVTTVLTDKDIHYCVNGRRFASCSKLKTIIEFVNIEDGKLIIEGASPIPGLSRNSTVRTFITYGNQYFECEDFVRRDEQGQNYFGEIYRLCGFRGSVPITEDMLGRKLHVCVEIDGHLALKYRNRYYHFSNINSKTEEQYYLKDGYVVRGTVPNIVVERFNPDKEAVKSEFTALRPEDADIVELCKFTDDQKRENPELILEEKYLYSLYSRYVEIQNGIRDHLDDDVLEDNIRDIIKRRRFAKTYKKQKPIWIISDRISIADDNGRALFEYIMKQDNVPADVYFLLAKDSSQFDELAKIGNVLEFGSEEHFNLHLVADVIISSSANHEVITPYGWKSLYFGERMYYADILNSQKVVFLQHGVTKDDISSWINKYRKNFTGIVTASRREADSFINTPQYFYDESKIWFTGFPRFDKLYDDDKKQITICPTWRDWMNGISQDAFKKSEFCRFYRALLTNERFIDSAKRAGYSVALKLHPMMIPYIGAFADIDIRLLDESEPYRKMYAESSLLITDYSSAVMDFAYLKKPVAYCRFDEETFFRNHIYEQGYFDYERDGFGPVSRDVESLVSDVVKIIENNCVMSETYRKRSEDFFIENDGNCCKRVYEKLLDL